MYSIGGLSPKLIVITSNQSMHRVRVSLVPRHSVRGEGRLVSTVRASSSVTSM